MVELEAIELVLQLSDLMTIRSHLGVVVACLLHDLVDDQLRVASDVKLSDAQLNGDAQAIDECLILSHIIQNREVDANCEPHAHPEGGNKNQPDPSALLP